MATCQVQPPHWTSVLNAQTGRGESRRSLLSSQSSDQRGRNQEVRCWGSKSYEVVSGGLLTCDSHSGESLGSRGVGGTV